MRKAIVLCAALLGLSACARADGDSDDMAVAAAPAAPHAPSAAQRAEILSTLQSVFDALATGDGDLLRRVMDPDIVMHSIEMQPDGSGSIGTSNLEGLVRRVTGSEAPLIERMFDAEVRVSGSLATIWAPYDFYSGGEFSHCGVDAATLERTPAGWKIVALSWTRIQPPDCELHPNGPPTG